MVCVDGFLHGTLRLLRVFRGFSLLRFRNMDSPVGASNPASLRKNLDCCVCSPSPLYKPFGIRLGLEKIRADMGGVLFGAVCRFCGSLPLFYKMKFDALGFISELVRFKSVSADSSKKSETRACAEFLNSTLRGLGFDSRLLETGGNPVVFARKNCASKNQVCQCKIKRPCGLRSGRKIFGLKWNIIPLRLLQTLRR